MRCKFKRGGDHRQPHPRCRIVFAIQPRNTQYHFPGTVGDPHFSRGLAVQFHTVVNTLLLFLTSSSILLTLSPRRANSCRCAASRSLAGAERADGFIYNHFPGLYLSLFLRACFLPNLPAALRLPTYAHRSSEVEFFGHARQDFT